jgi:hypothetical protein
MPKNKKGAPKGPARLPLCYEVSAKANFPIISSRLVIELAAFGCTADCENCEVRKSVEEGLPIDQCTEAGRAVVDSVLSLRDSDGSN